MLSEHQQKRVNKLKEEEFYLIGFDGEKILMTGSKKDVYTVKFGEDGALKCNCPDSCINSKKYDIVCKHVCFIYLKICKSIDLVFFETKKLTQIDIDKFKMRTKLLVSDEQAQKYMELYKKNMNNTSNDLFNTATRKDVLEDTYCPICMDDLVDDIAYCPQCSNPVHNKCIMKWLETNKNCIFCRSDVWKKYNCAKNESKQLFSNYVKISET